MQMLQTRRRTFDLPIINSGAREEREGQLPQQSERNEIEGICAILEKRLRPPDTTNFFVVLQSTARKCSKCPEACRHEFFVPTQFMFIGS